MESYRVNIDTKNYFEVDSYLKNDKARICNLRSVHGFIGEGFNFLSDAKLKKIVQDYLRITDNVELINILSREYNGWNWYDCYDSSYNVNHEITKSEILRVNQTKSEEHAVITACSPIISLQRFIQEVHAKGKNGLLSPEALKSYIHKGIPVEHKIDITKIKYIPIWHINGSARTNADKCELLCPLELLLHLLAKRFIEFKAKLLQLASTDVQLAKAQNETLESYAGFRKYQLIQELKNKDDKISKLEDQLSEINRKLDESKNREIEMNDRLINTEQQLTVANDRLINTEQQLTVANDRLINTEQQLTVANDRLINVEQIATDIATSCKETLDKNAENFTKNFDNLNVTTRSRKERIDVYKNRDLNIAYHREGKATGTEVVLDTFMGDAKHPERIEKHVYKVDDLIGSFFNANALDISDYIKKHKDRYPHIRYETKYRKFIVSSKKYIDETTELIDDYNNKSNKEIVKTANEYKDQGVVIVRNAIDKLRSLIHEEIHNEIHEEIHEEMTIAKNEVKDEIKTEIKNQQNKVKAEIRSEIHSEIQSEIQEMKEQMEEIKTVQQSLKEMYTRAHLTQTFLNYRYRDLIYKDDGNIYVKTTVNGEPIPLTLDMLPGLIFRSERGNRFRGGKKL